MGWSADGALTVITGDSVNTHTLGHTYMGTLSSRYHPQSEVFAPAESSRRRPRSGRGGQGRSPRVVRDGRREIESDRSSRRPSLGTPHFIPSGPHPHLYGNPRFSFVGGTYKGVFCRRTPEGSSTVEGREVSGSLPEEGTDPGSPGRYGYGV